MSAEPAPAFEPIGDAEWEQIRAAVEAARCDLARLGRRGATILEVHEGAHVPMDWHVHIEARIVTAGQRKKMC